MTAATEELIAETLAHNETATPGPWFHQLADNVIECVKCARLFEWQARSVSVSVATRNANAALVAHYRVAAPRLARMLKVTLSRLGVAMDDIDKADLLAEIERIAKGEV